MARQTVTVSEAKELWPDLKQRALRVYSATEFPPEPGEHCAWCPIRFSCRPECAVAIDTLDAVFGP